MKGNINKEMVDKMKRRESESELGGSLLASEIDHEEKKINKW
jgi:hypothetical protein